MTNGILETRHGHFVLHLHRANQSCSYVNVLGAWVRCPPPKQVSLGRDDLMLTNAIQIGKDIDQ